MPNQTAVQWTAIMRARYSPDQHNVCGQIKVVEVRVWIPRWWLPHNNASVKSIDFLQTGVRMPEMGARITGPLISAVSVSAREKQKAEIVMHSARQAYVRTSYRPAGHAAYLNVLPCWIGHCVTNGTPS